MTPRAWRGLVRLHGVFPDRPPIVFVHARDGSVGPYLNIARRLRSCEAYGITAPGLVDDEEPLRDTRSMAERYAEHLAAHLAGRPVSLAGWSFGGAIACEVATALTERGADVGHVFLLEPPSAMTHNDERLAEFPRLFALLDAVGPGPVMTPELAEQLERCGSERLGEGPPRTVAQLRRLVEVAHGGMTAMSEHVYRPYDGVCSLLLAQKYERHKRPGWERLLRDVTTLVLPGGHRAMVFDDDNATTVAAYLSNTVGDL